MRKCYISRNYKTPKSAGGKAKMDIECIMQQMGFINLGLPPTTHKNKVVDFLLTLAGVVKAMATLRRGDVLVLQYPMKKYYELVCNVAHRRGAKVITQIHDLGSFRRKKLTAKREVERLSHSDVIIAHNENMRRWLIGQGCQRPIVVLGIFDYLSETPISSQKSSPEPTRPYGIFFVGNLNARLNAFIYALGKQLQHTPFYLYGNHFHEDLSAPALRHQGFGIDTELMRHVQGDFGLSWYGDSLSEGSGDIGEYMQYNNPHKVSLYLRCHTPVILSKDAGLAHFIEGNGIGICVEDLSTIEERLSQITAEEYQKMSENVSRVAQQIADGHYFRKAVGEAISQL